MLRRVLCSQCFFSNPRAWVRLGTAFIFLGIGFSLVGWAQIAVLGELTHEFVVKAGVSYEEEIPVTNTTDHAVEVSITQTDYLFFADGSNIYGEPGSVPRSNASWITLYLPPRLLLNPGETTSMRYKIDVPNNPSLVGTYWSMLMVAPVLRSQVAPEEGVGIQTVMQYGIQVVTHISDTGERKIQIVNRELQLEKEGLAFRIDVENVGERWVRPEVWMELYNQQGDRVGRFESERQRVYPGCSVRYRFQLGDVSGGRYKALVVFDNGDEYVWGAQYSLDLWQQETP